MEYWTVGVLRQSGIALRVRVIGSAISAIIVLIVPLSRAREKETAAQSVQQLVHDRSGKEVRSETDEAARGQALRDVRSLLRQPLTVESGVQIALLNNRSLQATFEEIGVSAADVREAATIPNPRFDLAIRVPAKPPSGDPGVRAGSVPPCTGVVHGKRGRMAGSAVGSPPYDSFDRCAAVRKSLP